MFIQTLVPNWNENRRSIDTCWLFSVFLQLKEKAMLTRNKVIQSVNNLPESFTIDELIDRLIFIEKVEQGLNQAEEGKVISHDDVKEIIEKWSK